MSNKAYNATVSDAGFACNVVGDGSHASYACHLTNSLLTGIFGTTVPNEASAIITQDTTGLSLTISSVTVSTVLGVTTVTVTFNQNLPLSDVINGPFVVINVTLLYPSV